MRPVSKSGVLSHRPSGNPGAGRTLPSQAQIQLGSLPIPELSPYSLYQPVAIK